MNQRFMLRRRRRCRRGRLARYQSPVAPPAPYGVEEDAHYPVRATQGMVASVGCNGDAGWRGYLLKQGGNAVDAAVAVGYALAVTHPPQPGIWRRGFALLRTKDGATTAIDFVNGVGLARPVICSSTIRVTLAFLCR